MRDSPHHLSVSKACRTFFLGAVSALFLGSSAAKADDYSLVGSVVDTTIGDEVKKQFFPTRQGSISVYLDTRGDSASSGAITPLVSLYYRTPVGTMYPISSVTMGSIPIGPDGSVSDHVRENYLSNSIRQFPNPDAFLYKSLRQYPPYKRTAATIEALIPPDSDIDDAAARNLRGKSIIRYSALPTFDDFVLRQ